MLIAVHNTPHIQFIYYNNQYTYHFKLYILTDKLLKVLELEF